MPGAAGEPGLGARRTHSGKSAGRRGSVRRVVVEPVGPDDIQRRHGTDERGGVDAYANSVAPYFLHLKNAVL